MYRDYDPEITHFILKGASWGYGLGSAVGLGPAGAVIGTTAIGVDKAFESTEYGNAWKKHMDNVGSDVFDEFED